MLKADSKMFHDLCEEGIKDDKKDVFVDAFLEFIAELDDIDLSNKTKQHLYDIFIKDMNIYFKNKKYELLFPFVILDYLSDFLEWLCNKIGWFRTDIVYTTFKIIYKKEIILDMQKRGVLSERK